MHVIPKLTRALGVAATLGTISLDPSAAQQTTNAGAQDSMPLSLMFIVFPDAASAQKAAILLTGPQGYQAPEPSNAQPEDTAVAGVAAQDVEWIEPYYVIASTDKSGKVTAKQQGTKGESPRDTRAVSSIDGVTGLLGKPASRDTARAGGAGSSQAGVSSQDLGEMQDALDPGESALILVVAEPVVDDVAAEAKQAQASDIVEAPLLIVAE